MRESGVNGAGAALPELLKDGAAAAAPARPRQPPHLYSAAWLGVVASSTRASGGRCGGVLAATAAGLRGSGLRTPWNGLVPRMKELPGGGSGEEGWTGGSGAS
jgi:hypothetical protein